MGGRVDLLFVVLLCLLIDVESRDGRLIRRKRIVGGTAAAQPPVDDPVVFINKNGRNARVIGSRDPDKGFYTFRGIRFAEPPTGRSRFQRASPVRLEGDYNATVWAPPCPQPSHDGSGVVGSEDCLFLNVFTPSLPDLNDGYPVLVWIHGGGFRRGAACQYEMRNLIKKKMVVVSIQYRLGTLGFLSTGTREMSGNNGMFDMVLAVDWVRDYIHFFGGDPKKVVAFGHGTGAASAMMLSLSKFCEGTFSGVIAMSGSILSHFTVDSDPSATAKYIARKHGCPTDDARAMVRCLRELPVKDLIEVDSALENIRTVARGFVSGLSSLLGPGPVIEGPDDERSLPNFVTASPEESLRLGNFPAVPLLTGVMSDEAGGAVFGRYRDEVQNKLNTVPDYLTSDFIPYLQGTIPNMRNGSRFSPQAFRGYFDILGADDGRNTIGRVAEALSDSLYNAPAFLTVDRWSKKASAYLYTFDHKGRRSYGKDFLAGLPIVDAKHSSDGNLHHGDDLGYIFNRNTITGERMDDADESGEEDERVTEIFTDVIANFARSGTLGADVDASARSNDSALMPKLVPRFSEDADPFISITTSPKSMKNFRYCEMGLWTVAPERLQSPMCKLYEVPLQLLEQGTSVMRKPVDTITEFVPGLKPGLGVANKSTGPSTEGPDEETATRSETKGGGLLPQAPRIPFNFG